MIRPQLLTLLACPWCASPCLNQVLSSDTALLVCARCSHTYPFKHNIPLLYRDDAAWEPKRREADGWVALWKESGIYTTTTLIPELPFIPDEPWATVARMFQAALFQMDLQGTERILDLGAGEGWAAQHFARRGCHAVAIDIVPDPQLGLARAWKRMALSETTFDLVIGDNEHLPFQPNTFDVVFASNTLHHSNHLDQLLSSVYRVLRPGGRLIAIGDPVRSLFQPTRVVTDGAREKRHGIIEQRRRFWEYIFYMWRAGFRALHWDEERTWGMTAEELYPWLALQRVGIAQKRLFGSRIPAQLLSQLMVKAPRPFAMSLFASLEWSTLLLSGTKPR